MLRRIAITLAVAAASLAFVPTSAQASFCKLNYTCSLTYYSDAAHTEVVGRYTADCNGVIHETGTRTVYSSYYATICGP